MYCQGDVFSLCVAMELLCLCVCFRGDVLSLSVLSWRCCLRVVVDVLSMCCYRDVPLPMCCHGNALSLLCISIEVLYLYVLSPWRCVGVYTLPLRCLLFMCCHGDDVCVCVVIKIDGQTLGCVSMQLCLQCHRTKKGLCHHMTIFL